MQNTDSSRDSHDGTRRPYEAPSIEPIGQFVELTRTSGTNVYQADDPTTNNYTTS